MATTLKTVGINSTEQLQIDFLQGLNSMCRIKSDIYRLEVKMIFDRYSVDLADHEEQKLQTKEKTLHNLTNELIYTKKLTKAIQVELADRKDSSWRVPNPAIRKLLKLPESKVDWGISKYDSKIHVVGNTIKVDGKDCEIKSISGNRKYGIVLLVLAFNRGRNRQEFIARRFWR